MISFSNPPLKIEDRPFYGPNHELIPIIKSLLHSQIQKREYHYCLDQHSIETRHSSSHHKDPDPQLSCELINKGQILGTVYFNFL